MLSLSFLFGRNDSAGLFERSRKCMVTALTPSGRPQACKVKVAACADDGSRLWFVIPRDSGLMPHIERHPYVMISVMDPSTQRLVHVSGIAHPMEGRHEPVYLAPDFRQRAELRVEIDELDFVLLRVDLDERMEEDDLADGDTLPGRFRLPQPAWLSEMLSARPGAAGPAPGAN